jgi:hypothetical protein
MLDTQPEEGQWFLEDLDSLIRLDLRGASCVGRLYTEGSLVIIEGELIQGVLKVHVSQSQRFVFFHLLYE